MVKVPTYEPSVELKPTRINSNTAATLGGEVVDLGEGISALGNQIQKVQNESQSNKAQADLLNNLGRIHDQYALDNDLSTAPQRAREDMEKALEATANTISDHSARNDFMEQGQIELARKGTELDNMFTGKILKEAKYNMFNAVDAQIKQAWGSTRPGQYDQAKEDIKGIVQKAVDSGYVEPNAAKYYLNTHLDKLAEGRVDYDMNLNPKATNDKLKNNDPEYSDLKPDVREQKIKQSDMLIKRQAQQQKQQLLNYRGNNENYLNTLQSEGKLNAQTVNEFGVTGRISPASYKAWQKNFNSPILHGETNADTYNQAIHYMLNPKNSMADIRNHLLDAYGNKKLSKEDYLSLYEMHLRPFSNGDWKSVKDVYGKEQEQKDALRKHLNFMQSAVALISKYAGKDKDKTYAMMASWAAKTAKNVTPEDYPRMANDVLKNQRLVDNPEIATYPEDGRIIQDDDGHRSNATPDGGLEEDDKTMQLNPESDNGGSDNSSYGF